MQEWRFIAGLVIAMLVGVGSATPCEGQRLVDRGFVTNPMWDTEAAVDEGETRLINSYGGWAAFGPYVPSNDTHAWHHEIGGFIELRRSHRSSLLVTTQIEFVADPNNEISFNPRAVFWEEGIVYTRRTNAGFDWQLGYYHRCKHDVDNLERGTQRALIFGSVRSRAIIPLGEANTSDYVSIDADLYTIRQDARLPRVLEAEGRNWNQWLGSVGVQGFTQHSVGEQTGLYASAFGRMVLISENEGFTNRFSAIEGVEGSMGASAGLALEGRATLRLGVEYEYQSDTGIPVEPQSAHLLRIVARAQPLAAVR